MVVIWQIPQTLHHLAVQAAAVGVILLAQVLQVAQERQDKETLAVQDILAVSHLTAVAVAVQAQ
jgi:energy-converting hydrogenase Eha subunit G